MERLKLNFYKDKVFLLTDGTHELMPIIKQMGAKGRSLNERDALTISLEGVHYLVLSDLKLYKTALKAANLQSQSEAPCSLRSRRIISSLRFSKDRTFSPGETEQKQSYEVLKQAIKAKITIVTPKEIRHVFGKFKQLERKMIAKRSKKVKKNLDEKCTEIAFLSLNSADKLFLPIVKVFRDNDGGENSSQVPQIYKNAENCLFIDPKRKKKAVARELFLFCENCQSTFKQYDLHCRSEKHVKAMKREGIFDELDALLESMRFSGDKPNSQNRAQNKAISSINNSIE